MVFKSNLYSVASYKSHTASICIVYSSAQSVIDTLLQRRMVLVLCVYFLLATSVNGLFRCPKSGPTFTEDGCSTCHICHTDLTPTSLPTCENGTLCDVTLGYCNFKDQVVCPCK